MAALLPIDTLRRQVMSPDFMVDLAALSATWSRRWRLVASWHARPNGHLAIPAHQVALDRPSQRRPSFDGSPRRLSRFGSAMRQTSLPTLRTGKGTN